MEMQKPLPIKDSGTRQEFSTGSVRDAETGKGLPSLLSPIALTRLSRHMEAGARKYDARNWERGQPLSRYIDSTMRHLWAYMEGMRDEDHLAAAMWNIHGLIHTEEMVRRGLLPADLDDTVSYVAPKPRKDDA